MHEFSVEGPVNVWRGPIFEGLHEISLLAKALKFGVIFQKYAFKLIKIWKIIEKIREWNVKFSPKIFNLWARLWEK